MHIEFVRQIILVLWETFMRLETKLRFVLSGLLSALFLLSAHAADKKDAKDKPGDIVFNRDIRPIFAENCYTCHGPDKNKRKAKLRLDTEEGALAKTES